MNKNYKTACLDLFGQVVITNLDLKRKLKANRTLSVDHAIQEIIRNKIEIELGIEPHQSRPWNYHNLRDFNKRPIAFEIHELSSYHELCRTSSEYKGYLKRIMARIKFEKQMSQEFQSILRHNQKLDDARNKAIEVISRLTAGTVTMDKLMAKRNGKAYKPTIKTLVVEDVKILIRAKSIIPMDVVPWELATPSAKELAITSGIFRELSIPKHTFEANTQQKIK